MANRSHEYLIKTHSLEGKIALVTGAARGIGAGIALELGKKGAKVILNYTSDSSQEKAAAVLKEIEQYGSSGTLIKANMGNLDDIKSLAEKTIKYGQGKVDIIVNNAGVSENLPVTDVDEGHYARQYDINVRGPLFLMQHLLPAIQPNGRVINLSSVSARGGYNTQSVYGGTKAALEAMTRTWANEFAQSKQITVNCINPGPVESDMWNGVDENFRKGVLEGCKNLPSGPRIGQPDDIAKIVGWLAEEGSRWVNGNVICGNGGMMLL